MQAPRRSLSRKHSIALADTLAEIRRESKKCQTPFEVMLIVEAELAKFCQRHNPAFKPDVFLGYSLGVCGPSGGKKKEKASHG